jgi:hypothetical protein
MHQSLHLLIVDREDGEALATWHASRWLLPVLYIPERARAGPLALQWLLQRGIAGNVIGQWLGRATRGADAIDWLVVIDAGAHERLPATADLRWMPLQSLTTSAALLDYQDWALARTMSSGALPCVPGPFGSMTWLEEVKIRVAEVIGAPIGATVVPYRTTPNEVVVRLSTSRGNLFFKGLSSDRAGEARITRALSELVPDSFARTVMLEKRPGDAIWWLTERCPGIALANHADANGQMCERAGQVAAECARVQGRLMGHIAAGAASDIPVLDLSAPVEWGRALIERNSCPGRGNRYCGVLEQACRAVSVADVPRSWIPLDLDPSNVVLDDRAVRFIDLDDSFVGPAPLALATFRRRVERQHGGQHAAQMSKDAVCLAYEQAWSPSLDMGQRWSEFEVMSTLLEGYLGWTRLAKNLERGEVSRVLDLAEARAAGRLVRALSYCRR